MAPDRRPDNRSLKDIIEQHPLVVIGSGVVAVVGVLIAAVSWVDQRIQNQSIIEGKRIQNDILEEINIRAEAERLYSIDETGQKYGSIQAIQKAVRANRSIFVRYVRETEGSRSEWYRVCSEFVLDDKGGNQTVNCFALRIPDTSIMETGRRFEDETVFEDYLISTSGDVQWRKYRIENGQIEPIPGARPYRARTVAWYAMPEPASRPEKE